MSKVIFKIWIKEQRCFFYPTLFTIDLLNDTVSFPYMGKQYTAQLKDITILGVDASFSSED